MIYNNCKKVVYCTCLIKILKIPVNSYYIPSIKKMYVIYGSS